MAGQVWCSLWRVIGNAASCGVREYEAVRSWICDAICNIWLVTLVEVVVPFSILVLVDMEVDDWCVVQALAIHHWRWLYAMLVNWRTWMDGLLFPWSLVIIEVHWSGLTGVVWGSSAVVCWNCRQRTCGDVGDLMMLLVVMLRCGTSPGWNGLSWLAKVYYHHRQRCMSEMHILPGQGRSCLPFPPQRVTQWDLCNKESRVTLSPPLSLTLTWHQYLSTILKYINFPSSRDGFLGLGLQQENWYLKKISSKIKRPSLLLPFLTLSPLWCFCTFWMNYYIC